MNFQQLGSDYMRHVDPVNGVGLVKRASPLYIYNVCFFNILITCQPGQPALPGSRLLHTGTTRLSGLEIPM